MTDAERNDLLELRTFLEKSIPTVEQRLIDYSPDGSDEDYGFLVEKAVMYREALRRVNQQLETRDKE